jgi:ribonuclease T2
MIHGLWPQIDSENYPTYCEDVEYIEPTGELLQPMETYWQGCDDSLWRHEWEKHGSCMKRQNNVTENEFFNITLELFNSYKYLINEKCIIEDDNCIMGCFDLDFKLIT